MHCFFFELAACVLSLAKAMIETSKDVLRGEEGIEIIGRTTCIFSHWSYIRYIYIAPFELVLTLGHVISSSPGDVRMASHEEILDVGQVRVTSISSKAL